MRKSAKPVLLVLCGLLVACAEQQPQRTPEEQVRERAQARWQAMLAEDYESAYGFLSEGFRSKVTPKGYRNRFVGRTKWTRANVQGVACQPEVCEVQVVAGYRFQGAPPVPPFDGESTETEKWVQSGGEWWYVPRR